MKLSNVPRWINNIKTTKPGSNNHDFSSAAVAALCIWLEMRKLQIKATNSLLEMSQLSNRAYAVGVYQ